MQARIRDITALSSGVVAVTFEQDGDRDISLFKYRAGQEDIDALKVYHPAPDDPVIQVTLEQELAEWLTVWSKDRGVTEEQVLRAIFIYTVTWEAEERQRNREAAIHCKSTDENGGKSHGE